MQKNQRYILLGALFPTIVLVVFLARDLLSDTAKRKPQVAEAVVSNGSCTFAVVLPSVVALLAIVALIVLLYRRKSATPENQKLADAVSIDFAGLQASLDEALKAEHHSSRKLLDEAIGTASQQRTEVLQAFKQLAEIVGTLRKVLEEREQELKRYKQNHDVSLYRKFLRRAIEVCESAQDAALACPDKLSVIQVKELAEFMLEECDVKKFTPAIGALYREEFGVADSPRFVPNTDPAQARRIVRIIRPGYELVGGDTRQVIVPAKVEIFDDVKSTAP